MVRHHADLLVLRFANSVLGPVWDRRATATVASQRAAAEVIRAYSADATNFR